MLMLVYNISYYNYAVVFHQTLFSSTFVHVSTRSEGRFSIGSSGHKNMYVGLGLNGLKLEAKAGIVGGSIDLGRIDAYCHLREDSKTDPFHEVTFYNRDFRGCS